VLSHLLPYKKEDDGFLRNELYEKLPYEQAKANIKAAHRPNRTISDI
jgi:hypothetical protein